MNACGTKLQMDERDRNKSEKNIWCSLMIKQPHIEIWGHNTHIYFFRYLSIDSSTEFVHCNYGCRSELKYFLNWIFCIMQWLTWCNTLPSNYFLDAKRNSLTDVQPWTSLSFICKIKISQARPNSRALNSRDQLLDNLLPFNSKFRYSIKQAFIICL